MRYIVNDIELNLHSGSIFKNGQTIHIRSKTFLVLKYFIEHREHVVTKQELLDSIWDDVVVQEQVLVQSVKEIRDLLGSDVIKTFPRKGYQWVAELTIRSGSNLSAPHLSTFKIIQRIVATIIISLLTIWLYKNFIQSPIAETELIPKDKILSIAFLPVENAMPDDIHDWVPLKGMDYLNQKLALQSTLNVIESYDLLQAIARSNKVNEMSFDKVGNNEKVFLIRKKLGADLIVQTRLIGYPEDYQLHYTIYSPYSIERGVELADSVNKTFDQLIKKIGGRFSKFTEKSSNDHQSDFSSEAFVSGIEYYLQRDYNNAISFFNTAIQVNPNLLAARRYLAACYANTGNVNKGITLMLKNIELAQHQSQPREEIRAYLMIGYLLINWHEEIKSQTATLNTAEQYITTAQQLAERYEDPLFIAYAFEELGKIKRLQKDYPFAIDLLKKSLVYHQKFNGSYGQTNALIELARIAYAQNLPVLAESYFQKALTIANDNGVANNKVWILLAQADVKLQQGNDIEAKKLAKQAMEVAQTAKSEYLLSRVTAWFSDNQRYELK